MAHIRKDPGKNFGTNSTISTAGQWYCAVFTSSELPDYIATFKASSTTFINASLMTQQLSDKSVRMPATFQPFEARRLQVIAIAEAQLEANKLDLTAIANAPANSLGGRAKALLDRVWNREFELAGIYTESQP